MFFYQLGTRINSELTVCKIIRNIANNMDVIAVVFESSMVICSDDTYEIKDGYKVVLHDCDSDKAEMFISLIK